MHTSAKMCSNGIPGVRVIRLIREQYGEEALSHARMWEKFAKRESAGHEQLAFLHSCRENDEPRYQQSQSGNRWQSDQSPDYAVNG